MKHAIIAILCISILSILAFSSIGYAQDWPMFREDLSHTGVTTSGAPNDNTLLWSFQENEHVHSSPAVVNGRVYIGSRHMHDLNWVYCIDENSGEVVWRSSVGGMIEDSSPAVVDGRVYIGCRDSNVYCFDASNGNVLWTFQSELAPVTLSSEVHSSPAVSDGKVYIGSNDGNVYCLYADNGGLVWNYPIQCYIYSSPAVVGGAVYIASYIAPQHGGNPANVNTVYCLNAETGEFVWRFQTGGSIYSSPAVVDGKVYIGSDDGNVYCLDASTGAKLWNYQTGESVSSSPAISNGKVYVGSGDFNVYCLSADDGSKIWSFPTGSRVHSSPAIADGKVYVGSYDGKFYCLNAETGDLVWSYQTGDLVHSSPAVADNRVFVGSYDGYLYAFGEPDFSVSVTPASGDVLQGGSINTTVKVDIIGSENVKLDTMDAPPGSTVNFAPTSGIKTFISIMTIKTAPNTPSRTYDVVIIGTHGDKTRTARYSLRVGLPEVPQAMLFLPLVLLLLTIPTLAYWWKTRKKYRRSKVAPTGRQTRGILRT
jgi:outer membrane protein assembly factor BamB